jgi:hypothetical protein
MLSEAISRVAGAQSRIRVGIGQISSKAKKCAKLRSNRQGNNARNHNTVQQGVLYAHRIRASVFGSFSHRDLRFAENQVWRFALSTCSFDVEKEKRGLFIDSEGENRLVGGDILASCRRGVFAATEERLAPLRNRFSITLSRSKGGSSEKETNVRSNRPTSSDWRASKSGTNFFSFPLELCGVIC